jgi:hypothetical protein
MLKVKFASARDGGVMAKIDGKVSFPERRGPQPKPGEEWLVEITGQNPKGTVNFLKCVRPWRGTIQDCRDLGAVEEVERLLLWRVLFRYNQEIVGIFYIENNREEFPALAREMDEEMEQARREWEQYKAEEEAKAASILAKIQGHELETKVVFATHYKVEIISDEDFGLHKADDGYSIRVTPMYEGAVENPYRQILDELAREHFGGTWLDVEEMAEDEACSDVKGIGQALIDLSADKVAGKYYQLMVNLTKDQINEIDNKYADRINRRFATTAEWWLPKK